MSFSKNIRTLVNNIDHVSFDATDKVAAFSRVKGSSNLLLRLSTSLLLKCCTNETVSLKEQSKASSAVNKNETPEALSDIAQQEDNISKNLNIL